MWLGTHVGSQPPFLVAGESFWVLRRFLDHRMVPCGVPWVLHGSSRSHQYICFFKGLDSPVSLEFWTHQSKNIVKFWTHQRKKQS